MLSSPSPPCSSTPEPVRKVAAEVGRPLQVGSDLLGHIAAGQPRAGGGTSRPSRATCRRRSRRCRGTRHCCASRSPTPDRVSAGRPARRCRSPGETDCRARDRGCSGRARGRGMARPRARGLAAGSDPTSRFRHRFFAAAVAAVHARPDHHDIEVGISGRLIVSAADEAPENVEREGRPLDVRLARRKWQKRSG